MNHHDKLREAPERYHLFMALRILEAEHSGTPRLGQSRRPHEDAVRLAQEAELAFPPTTVREIDTTKNGKPRLINRFFGFFGPHGPLPLHITEYARERQINEGDPTLVDFLNMLTHRAMSLLYRAWTRGQPAVDLDRGEGTRFESHVAALSGYHGEHLRRRDAMPDMAKRHFAGLLAMGPRNPDGLKALIAGFFAAPVDVEEFVGSWLELEKQDQWQLGRPARLGQDTSIGSSVFSRAAKFRLRIGPLSLKEYERLLPGGASLARLAAIVRNYAGDALDYDVNIVLRADEVPPAILGQNVRLGHLGWIGNRPDGRDADELNLSPQTIGTAPI